MARAKEEWFRQFLKLENGIPADGGQLRCASQHHWAIDDSFHWVMGVTFSEDRSRIRLADSPENFSILRQLALTILKRDKSKGSLKGKRFKAALHEDFRLQLVRNLHASALVRPCAPLL